MYIWPSTTVGRLPAAISFSPRRLESIYCRTYDQRTLHCFTNAITWILDLLFTTREYHIEKHMIETQRR